MEPGYPKACCELLFALHPQRTNHMHAVPAQPRLPRGQLCPSHWSTFSNGVCIQSWFTYSFFWLYLHVVHLFPVFSPNGSRDSAASPRSLEECLLPSRLSALTPSGNEG